MTQKTPQIYLVDGSGYIFRAFHALPPLTRPDGAPVGAVMGFTSMLIKLLREKSPDYLVVIFDAGRETYRHQIFPAYKANRQETPPELIPQFSLVRQACEALSVPFVEKEGFEADDLIATYAHSLKGDVTIVSSDKDLMQLVGGSIRMFDPMKNRSIGVEEVQEKFGVPPSQVVDVQALAGDSSDNVPGVPGIGIKTAAELIRTYGTLENLLTHAEEIKQPKRREALLTHQEDARTSKRLVSLDAHVPMLESLQDFSVKPVDFKKASAFLKEQHFHSLLARLEKSQPISSSLTTHYALVQTKDALTRWIQAITQTGQVAFELELSSSTDIVGIALSTAPGKGGYIPVGHREETRELLTDTPPLQQLSLDHVLTTLKPLFENPGILKISHHMKRNVLVLKRQGLAVTPLEDTMVMSYVLAGTKHGHELPELAKLYLNQDLLTYGEIVGAGRSKVPFETLAPQTVLNFATQQADITGQLYPLLKEQLLQEHQCTVYETLERPLIPILADMEYRGIKVDPLVLKKLSGELEKRLHELEGQIQEETGQSFNVGSPKQLGEILFDVLKLPGGKKGKTGAYGTAADVLETLAEAGYGIADKILEWRQLAKLKSTYTDSLPLQIHPKTQRVHTTYAMTVTSTGRLASSDPNLQNIPIRTEIGKRIRSAFVASPGNLLLSADYSQIELRLLAHMADLPELRQAFIEKRDIHAQTASQVFGVPLDQVTPELRYRAKAINFGIIYGLSPFGLARQLGISRENAAQYIQAYFTHHPGVQTYMERMKTEAREHGYVTTLLGRRCFISDIHSRDPNKRNFAERQAINAPLQGGNADIMMRAMVKLDRLLREKNLKGAMLLQVHDELILEVAEEEVDKVQSLVVDTMQTIVDLSVPLVVEADVGKTWAEI